MLPILLYYSDLIPDFGEGELQLTHGMQILCKLLRSP